MKSLRIGVMVSGSRNTFVLQAEFVCIHAETLSQTFNVDCFKDDQLVTTIPVTLPPSLLSGGSLFDMGIYIVQEVKNDFWWNQGILIQRHIVGLFVEPSDFNFPPSTESQEVIYCQHCQRPGCKGC